MADLSQANFDRSEEIADALSVLAGLEAALVRALSEDCLLAAEREREVFALIGSMAHYRVRAECLAGDIARSGVPA